MRKNRLLLIFALALACGGLAGVLALRQLSPRTIPAMIMEPRPSTTQVAVAAHDLPIGSMLRVEDVRMLAWPSEVVPAGYSSSTADLLGRGLITPMKANEPFLDAKLADPESGGGLPILIPAGMRAVSVRVDEVISVAGFVTPGTRVDVLVTVSPSGGGGDNAITRLILQNVQVLAAGQTIERDEEGKPQTVTVVTVMVKPDEGERLVLAANEGRIQLALRGSLDVAETTTQGVRIANLVSGSGAARPVVAAASAPRPAPAPPQTVVEMIRGNERTLNTFR
jgi:pilus assembly protein CpaB